RRHVHADLVGDLLHLERFDELWAVLQELRLVIDDGLRNLGERAAALLDRFDEPLGGIDLALDVFALFGSGRPALQALAVITADVQRRRAAVIDDYLVVAVRRAFDEHIGRDGGNEGFAKSRAGFGIELAELDPGFLNRVDWKAGGLVDQRE